MTHLLGQTKHLQLLLNFMINPLSEPPPQLSVLSGSTHLAPHHGIMNTKLRAHLPLLIPAHPAPVLVVAGTNLTWTEGTMIVFDDTYKHEVRVVLPIQGGKKN